MSLGLTALTILLRTPAAYHRIVEEGENTERFYRLASRMVLAALVPLALALSGDFFIVLRQIIVSIRAPAAGSFILLTFFYGLWFGFTLYRKNRGSIQMIRLPQ